MKIWFEELRHGENPYWPSSSFDFTISRQVFSRHLGYTFLGKLKTNQIKFIVFQTCREKEKPQAQSLFKKVNLNDVTVLITVLLKFIQKNIFFGILARQHQITRKFTSQGAS